MGLPLALYVEQELMSTTKGEPLYIVVCLMSIAINLAKCKHIVACAS